jgi:hypothetical protein
MRLAGGAKGVLDDVRQSTLATDLVDVLPYERQHLLDRRGDLMLGCGPRRGVRSHHDVERAPGRR